LLPDGDTGFDGIDEKSISIEGCFAMGRGGKGRNRAIADVQGPDAMDGDCFGDWKSFHGLGKNTLPLFLCEDQVMGVAEFGDVATFVVIANEALEDHEGSAGGVGHVGTEGREVEGSVLDREHEIYE
tara:strand:+ start:22717 stop:23097 length:381 start_codon:yes stop_codon:yes gene_type:complete